MSQERYTQTTQSKKLTLFSDEHRLEFSTGLNLFVGENGIGKIHLMKTMYSLIAICEEVHWKQTNVSTKTVK